MSSSTPPGPPRPRTPGGGSKSAGSGKRPPGSGSGGSGSGGSGRTSGSGSARGATAGAPRAGGSGSGSGRPGAPGSGSGSGRPPRRDGATSGYQGRRTDPGERGARGGRTDGPDGARSGRPPARRTGSGSGSSYTDRPDGRPDRGQVVRKGWGSVARRGASQVRDGVDHGPDEDTPEGRRRAKKRTDEFVPETFVRVDDRRGTHPGRTPEPAHRPVREPDELPADIAQELATAAGPDWNFLRIRITERMTAGIGAYERERYRDAARILRTVVDAVPTAPSARELLGLSQYHQGHWKAALPNLEMFATLTGSVDQHPVRMDCQRALGRPKRVEALFEELRKGSPNPEVLTEGRLVLAGTRADLGDLDGAVSLLVDAGAGRLIRNPSERHLRQWYVLADLTERSGDLAKARELFLRVAAVDPDAYDVRERLESLGPPTKARRTPNRTRGAR